MNRTYSGTHPLHIAWQALRALYEELFAFVLLSLFTWLCTLSVVLSFPAIGALFEMARLALEGRTVSVDQWWAQVRAQGGRAWILGLTTTLITLILLANVIFYARLGHPVAQYIMVVWLWLLLMWVMSLPYMWAFNAILAEPRVRFILRNALYLLFLKPAHTLVAVLVLIAATGISVVLPLFFLVLPAYLALYVTLLTRQLVLDVQRRHQAR